MNAKLARLYIDPLFADVGDTEMTNFLRSFDIEIAFGTYPAFNGSANETFDVVGQDVIGFSASFTVVRGAASEALRAAIGENRAIRLAITGPKISSTGKNHSLTLDMHGYIDSVVAMASNDRSKSANLDTLVIHEKPDPVSGKMIVPAISTNLAAI